MWVLGQLGQVTTDNGIQVKVKHRAIKYPREELDLRPPTWPPVFERYPLAGYIHIREADKPMVSKILGNHIHQSFYIGWGVGFLAS
jgi:hypothetical protein